MSNFRFPEGWEIFANIDEVPHPPDNAGQTANPDSRTSGHPQDWVPRGEIVSIHGRKIPGMVYVGTPPRTGERDYHRQKCLAYIDPSLPVAQSDEDCDPNTIHYLSGYSTISPECRAGYLDWLSSGANDGTCPPGYVMLYFFGLERRFFLGPPDLEEKQEILDETRRLAALLADNHPRRPPYIDKFIGFAVAAIQDVDDIQPIFENSDWRLPFAVKWVIGNRIEKGINLDAYWLLSWFLCDPAKKLRVPAKRCPKEFRMLFKARFDAQLPEGLKVRTSMQTLDHVYYRGAAAEFTVVIRPVVNGNSIPDIYFINEPNDTAQQIADEVMDELDKFSRYLGRNPNERESLKASALLPNELRQMLEPEQLRQLNQAKVWAEGVVKQGGLIKVGHISLRLKGRKPVRPGKHEWADAEDVLARLGFGIEPDLQAALKPPQFNDWVVLFDLGGPADQCEDVSKTYKMALTELALAIFVSQADGTISALERRNLDDQIYLTANLSDCEQRRLRANLIWFLAVPPDMVLLRRKLKEVEPKQHSRIRKILVAATQADGSAKLEEITAIKKIYRALGLAAKLVNSDLHKAEAPSVPSHVRTAQLGKSDHAVPSKRKKKLDTKRIAHIKKDTELVSKTLADIFAVGEDEEASNSEPSSILSELDEKHCALVNEIITRKHWSHDEFTDLAARHGLMAAGALETINEWAFESYDEALIEDYEGYDVSPDIVDALAEKNENGKELKDQN